MYEHHSKDTAFVDYPVSGLDMAPFVASPDSKANAVYDLYGIVKHFGGISGGHYAACCNNPKDGKWYTFDDSYVCEAEDRELVDSDAYVL